MYPLAFQKLKRHLVPLGPPKERLWWTLQILKHHPNGRETVERKMKLEVRLLYTCIILYYKNYSTEVMLNYLPRENVTMIDLNHPNIGSHIKFAVCFGNDWAM